MREFRAIGAAGLCGLLTLTSGGAAASVTDFNLIAFGDLTGDSEIEGRSAVFGDAAGGSKTFTSQPFFNDAPVSTPGLAQNDALIVGGDITATAPLNVNNGGNTRVAGGIGPIVNSNGGGAASAGDAGVAGILDAVTADVAETQSFFAAQAVNSAIDLSDANNTVFNAVANSDGVAVFEIESSVLFSRSGTFDLADDGDLDADLFLIRVLGSDDVTTTALNPNSNEFNLDEFQSRIVFYFADAISETDIQFGGGLGGSLFAPEANVTIVNPLEGTVVANNVLLNSEIHLPTLVVPEPGTAALLGLASLGLWRRRVSR